VEEVLLSTSETDDSVSTVFELIEPVAINMIGGALVIRKVFLEYSQIRAAQKLSY
jgi:hypothetical protein